MPGYRRLALRTASAATLLVALGCALMVSERLHAAAWQWFKFAGHGNDGQITLSLQTGLWFSAVLALLLGIAGGLLSHARRHADDAATFVSRLAAWVLVAAAACYWLLGWSSLNAWRP